MGFIIVGYIALWLAFDLTAKFTIVPLGTDVCFDDWCASVTQIESSPEIQQQFSPGKTDSTWIVLHIRMSNHARGIAQKPSEPRVHIIDQQGNVWPYSKKGQQLLEKAWGQQPSLGQQLELKQSIETKLIFSIPSQSEGLKILIEEGPFITKLLFPEDNTVFKIKK